MSGFVILKSSVRVFFAKRNEAKNVSRTFSFVLFLFSSFIGFSQTVGTMVSKNEIKIGEQIQLTLKTKVNDKDLVVFPDLDSIGKLEVVQSFPPEKTKKANQIEWIKKYNLTQFDAGKYKIPSLEVVVNKKKINSESIEISVVDVAGKVVKTSTINGLTSTINASDLTNGVYYVTITDGTSVATEKVVIKK